MSYKSIDETFWTDPKIKQLDPETKYLFLYLITNPHTHYSGLYYLPIQIISVETGLSEDKTRRGIDALSKGHHVRYDGAFSTIWVINMCRYQVKNIKNDDKKFKGIANHFETLHKCPLIKDFMKYYHTLPIPYRYHTEGVSIPIRYPPDTHSITEAEAEAEAEEKDILSSEQKTVHSTPSIGFDMPPDISAEDVEKLNTLEYSTRTEHSEGGNGRVAKEDIPVVVDSACDHIPPGEENSPGNYPDNDVDGDGLSQGRENDSGCIGEDTERSNAGITKARYKESIIEIINYFNQKAETTYKYNSKETVKLIVARLKSGFTVEDFKKVIDKKVAQWKNDPKMGMYLRPITLFSTKFESYLNEQSGGFYGKRTFEHVGINEKDYTEGL